MDFTVQPQRPCQAGLEFPDWGAHQDPFGNSLVVQVVQEIFNQLSTYFADVQPFLEANLDISPKTTDRLLLILRDGDDNVRLQIN